MKKREVKVGLNVIDRWYPEMGTGHITKVLKTVLKVNFNGKELTYDFPHAFFLDEVK